MSPLRRKPHSKDPGSALAPIVQLHLDQIEWALMYGSDIVVFSNEPGAEEHNYVRRVKDHPRPKTLQIGPVSLDQVDELAAFIRSSLDLSGKSAAEPGQITIPEFSYPMGTIVRPSVGGNADADC